jgi:precorrin-6x reductase
MFIGSTSVVTDAAGQAALAATFSADVPVEYYATATAIDPEGNTSGFSAATEVEALSSQQQVQILVDAVHDFADAGVLKASQTNGLIAKLRAAIDALDRDKSKVAVNRLSDFIDQVEGVLSPEDGAELIALAQRMIERISG